MATRTHTNRLAVSTLIATAIAITIAAVAAVANAQESGGGRRYEASLLGGVQALNQNDTAIPDNFVNIPLAAALAWHFHPNFAAEGEFSWLIPVQQSVDMGSGVSTDRKTPGILTYQANLRASWPLTTWTPYLVGGLGAMTFLSNTDADRVPQLQDAQTVFAINFGAGTSYDLTARWALRADFREFAGFPTNSTSGLSSSGSADPVWMERGTVGVAYRF